MAHARAMGVSDEVVASLQEWRTRALNALLVVAAVLGLPTVAHIVITTSANGRNWTITGLFLALYLLLLGITLLRKLELRIRVWGLLVIGYDIGILALIRGGIAGDGRVFLIILPIAAQILIGMRTGLVTTALSLVLYVAFSLFAHWGWLADWLTVTTNPLQLRDWLNSGASLFLLLIPTLVLLRQMQKQLLKTMTADRQTVADMVETAQLLRERARKSDDVQRRLDRYTKQLEVSAEIGRATSQLLNLETLLPRAADLIQHKLGHTLVLIFLLDETGRWAVARGGSGEIGSQLVHDGLKLEVPDEGMVGKAISQRSPYIAQDVANDRHYLANPTFPVVHSAVAIPLLVGDHLIGALDVESREPDTFDEDTLTILQGIASQLAIAIENARKFLDEAAILQETNSYFRHSQAISTASRRQGIGEALLGYALSAPIDGAEIIWADSPDASQHPLYSLLAQQQFMTVEDTANDPRTVNMLSAGQIETLGSFVMLAIVHDDTWYGGLIVRRDQPSEFDPRLVQSLCSLARQAGAAMQGLKLLHKSQQQAHQEQLIRTVSSHLGASETIKDVLENSVQQIGKHLGVSRVAVRLYTDGSDGRDPEEIEHA